MSLAIARLKYWVWTLFVKVSLGIVCVLIIAEGLRVLIPALGQRLHQVPFLRFLKNYEGTHKIDLAPFMAVMLMIAVFILWDRILSLWLQVEEESNVNPENETTLVCALGIAVLGADAILFYTAICHISWGKSYLSMSAVVASAAYLGILIFVSYVGVKFRQQLKDLQKGESR